MNFLPDHSEFLRLLGAHFVEYVVVGGYAVGRHGHPRFTGDLDVLVKPEPENARRLLAALSAFGFGNMGFTQEDFLTASRVVQLGVPPLRIDLITSVDGVTNEEIFANRVTDQGAEGVVQFIGYEQLIKNKRAAGRPKDVADLAQL